MGYPYSKCCLCAFLVFGREPQGSRVVADQMLGCTDVIIPKPLIIAVFL